MKPWRLEEGLTLVRALQEKTRTFGFHIALGGSVLNTGESDKDLDLYFLPFNNTKVAKEDDSGLIQWLSKLWGEPRVIGNYDQPDPEPIDLSLPRAGRPRLEQDGDGRWLLRTEPRRNLGNQLRRLAEDGPIPTPARIAEADQAIDRMARYLDQTTEEAKSSYKHKLKFNRAGSDRIDVFIV